MNSTVTVVAPYPILQNGRTVMANSRGAGCQGGVDGSNGGCIETAPKALAPWRMKLIRGMLHAWQVGHGLSMTSMTGPLGVAGGTRG